MVTTMLFLFNRSIINYCIIAFGIVLIINTLTWNFDGRKNYKGPQIELVGEHVIGGHDFDVSRDFDVDDQYKHGSKGGIHPNELPNGNGVAAEMNRDR